MYGVRNIFDIVYLRSFHLLQPCRKYRQIHIHILFYFETYIFSCPILSNHTIIFVIYSTYVFFDFGHPNDGQNLAWIQWFSVKLVSMSKPYTPKNLSKVSSIGFSVNSSYFPSFSFMTPLHGNDGIYEHKTAKVGMSGSHSNVKKWDIFSYWELTKRHISALVKWYF